MSEAWNVTLECLTEEGVTYLYEIHAPEQGRKVETPREAIDYALKVTACDGEMVCGIDEVRKVGETGRGNPSTTETAQGGESNV